MAFPGGEAGRHEIRRKEFGERGGDGFDERGLLHERDIAVAGGSDARQDRAKGSDVFFIEADPAGESSPESQPAVIVAHSVVIVNAVNPCSTKCLVFRFRQDERVLDRNPGLVIVAVEDPLLQLMASQAALVHQAMKRVPVVIATFSFHPKPGHEFGTTE